MAEPWTAEEIGATVDAYLTMLDLELRGEPFSKSEFRRRLQPRLRGRSEGAIERKHQNISAVLIGLHWPYIDGYKPLGNVQRALAEEVAQRIGRIAPEVLERSVSPPADLVAAARLTLVEPPDGEAASVEWMAPGWRPGAVGVAERKVDYLELEQRQRVLGLAGERTVFEWEQARLRAVCKDALAERVEWVSQTRGDGTGSVRDLAWLRAAAAAAGCVAASSA